MSMSILSRRQLLQCIAGAGAALPLAPFFPSGVAHAAGRAADRVVFFYVPDGMHQADWGLGGRQWGALGERARDCTLLQGVSMGGGESHPSGARRLLCGGEEDNRTSIDQFLSLTVGKGAFYEHLYLGASSTRRGTKNKDDLISYVNGTEVSLEENPLTAFTKLFPGGSIPPTSSSQGGSSASGGVTLSDAERARLKRRRSILDAVLGDINDLKTSMSTGDQRKLDRHLQATRDVELRLQKLMAPQGTPGGGPSTAPEPTPKCDKPTLDRRNLDDASLYDDTRFPDVVGAQLDVLTQALACGTTRVATLQLSKHTSELYMPFAPGSAKQRSHEASHNNASVHLDQRVWFLSQFKSLLDRLAQRDDPYVQGAKLLDRTLVLFCTEINWGPTHQFSDMPFILAGGHGGKLRSGGAFGVNGAHTGVHAAIAHALGGSTQGWRDAPQPVSGLVS
jgi:hypothetical protein